jgi:hypothetical protein
LGISWSVSAESAEPNRAKGQMKNKYIKKMKPIKITVKNFYGEAWINVVCLANEAYALGELFKTKKDASLKYPSLIDNKYKKIVKVWLVEAL